MISDNFYGEVDELSSFQQLMNELFLQACAIEMPKLFPNTPKHMESWRSQLGGESFSLGEDEKDKERARRHTLLKLVEQAAILLQPKTEEIMKHIHYLIFIHTINSHYRNIPVQRFLDFFTTPTRAFPMIRVAWDEDWQQRIRDIIWQKEQFN